MMTVQSFLAQGKTLSRRTLSSLSSLLLSLVVASALQASPHVPTGSGDGPPPKPFEQPPCPENTCCTPPSAGDPVEIYNGRLYLVNTDITVKGVMPISMTRRYDSHKSYDSPLGYGWGFTYDRRLYTYEDGSAVLRIHCGRRIKYQQSGGAYVAPEGVFYDLVENGDGSHTLNFKSGRKEQYDAEGRLTAMVDPQGNQLEMLYDPAGKLPLTGSSPFSINPDVPQVVSYDYRLTRVQERLADGSLSGHFVDISYGANNGRLSKIKASDGREVTYVHDVTESKTHGNLLTVNGLEGLVSQFLYNDSNDAHNVTSIQVGASTTPYVNTYDTQDRVTQQTHGNDTLKFQYVIPGMETKVTQIIKAPDDSVLHTAVQTYEFNERGDLINMIDALGHEHRTILNSQYRPVKSEIWQKDGRNLSLYQAINRTFDSDGNKLTESVTLDSGETVTTSWTYYRSWVESMQTVSSLRPEEVFRTEYEFHNDAAGNPTNIKAVKRRKADGTFQTTQLDYDSQGRPLVTTLPDGVQMVNEYTGDFLTKTYYRVDGKAIPQMQQRFAYDARGNRNKAWDANGNLTQYQFDDRGRVVKTINALGQEEIVTYQDDNLVRVERGRTEADGEGQVTRMSYDGNENLILVEAKNDSGVWIPVIVNTYDSNNNRLTSTDAEGRTIKTAFDALNRVIITEDAIGNITQLTYDAVGNQVSSVDALNRVTAMFYDELNRIVKTEQRAVSPVATTRYSYDALGNLLTVTDPENSTTRYDYDRLSRRFRVKHPLGQVAFYEYDERDRQTAKIGSRGQQLRYQYYSWGPVEIQQHFAPGATEASRDIKFAYDNNASLLSVTDNGIQTGVALSHAYDELNRPVSKTVHYIPGGEKVITSSYDRFGNRSGASLNDSNVSVSTFAYDKRNHLAEATLPGNRQYAFEYFRNNDMKSISYPSGVKRAYTYQANGPVKDISVKAANDDSIEQWRYDYDKVLNITGLTDSLGDRTYGYDGLDHLSRADYPDGSGLSDENYQYDKVGNRTESSTTNEYKYDKNHRLIEVDGVSLDYDVDGSLVSKSDGTTMSYDVLNRLSQYSKADISATYQYDVANQRFKKTVNGVTTWYLYDGSHLMAEYDNSGSRIKRYDYLPFGFAPIQLSENSAIYEVQSDHLDTPRVLINEDQIVVWRSNHQAFGATQADEDVDGDGVSIQFNIRSPGQYADGESGLYYNWNRYYDPIIGRYVTRDPIGLLGGVNVYNFVNGNPIRYFDNEGLKITGKWNPAPSLTEISFSIGVPQISSDYKSVIVGGSGTAAVGFGISCSDDCTGEKWDMGPYSLGVGASATAEIPVTIVACALIVGAGARRVPKQARKRYLALLWACRAGLIMKGKEAASYVESAIESEIFAKGSEIMGKLYREGPTKFCGG